MQKQKEFSVLKWAVFPSMSLTLAAIVAWFNVTVFGWRDGAFYIIAVVIIAAFSIAINKYVGSPLMHMAVAAFVFELVLILALGANAIYSLSVQREMSVARQAEASNIEAVREIKQLKSRQAQRDATRMVVNGHQDNKNAQTIFAENERILLYLMSGEMLAYILTAFGLLGLSHLTRREAPVIAQPQPVKIEEAQQPSAPAVETRATSVLPPAPTGLRRPMARPMTVAKSESQNGSGGALDRPRRDS